MSDKHPRDNKVVDFRSFERRGRKGPSSRKKLRWQRQKELISKESYRNRKHSLYYPGSYLTCQIESRAEDGYVLIVNHELPGFLYSQTEYKPGSFHVFQFVCVEMNRIIVDEENVPEKNGQLTNLFYQVKGDASNLNLSDEYFPAKDNCVPIDSHRELES